MRVVRLSAAVGRRVAGAPLSACCFVVLMRSLEHVAHLGLFQLLVGFSFRLARRAPHAADDVVLSCIRGYRR